MPLPRRELELSVACMEYFACVLLAHLCFLPGYKQAAAGHQDRLNFDGFLDLLTAVAVRKFSPLPENEATHKLLFFHVLPRARRVDRVYTEIDFFNPEVTDLSQQNERALKMVFFSCFAPLLWSSSLLTLFFCSFSTRMPR